MGGGNGMLPSVHTAAKTGDRPAHAPPSPPALCPQGRFDWEASGFDRPPLLSYGPCQFPTLGLIVQV